MHLLQLVRKFWLLHAYEYWTDQLLGALAVAKH